jgi:hypothetical protein
MRILGGEIERGPKRSRKAGFATLVLFSISLANSGAASKSPPKTRAAILGAYGTPCVDYSASFYDPKARRRSIHTALGFCYPRTPSLAKLFVLIDGVAYSDFHYKRGEMMIGDAKTLIDVNTPKT